MRFLTTTIFTCLLMVAFNQKQQKKLHPFHDEQSRVDNSSFKEVQDVSLISLIVSPEKYNGKQVRTIGYLHLEFEGDCLYLHKEDYTHAIEKNAIWVDLKTRSELAKFRKFSDHYVLIEGIFDNKDNGHMGMNSGSIKNISRLEVWLSTNKK